MQPTIPPEVVDLVIDNLHDHPATLRACSLVNRQWLAASRHHLYHEVYVTDSNLSGFIDLTGHPHDTLSLRLRSLHAMRFRYEEFRRLWSLLPGFPNLRGLHVHGAPLEFEAGYDLLQPQPLPTVTSLSISRGVFDSYEGLNALLLRLMFLKVLNLDCTFAFGARNEGLGDINIASFARPNLQVLHLTTTPSMLGWLKWSQFCLRAECIEMHVSSIQTGLSEYFMALSSQLKHLTLRFQTPSTLAVFSERPLLQYSTALCSLRITNAFFVVGEGVICVAPGLARLLEQLESWTHTLEELAFNVTFAYPGVMWTHTSPQTAAQILDRSMSTKLRKVEFFGPWDRADDILRRQFHSAVCALLPLLHSRGIVAVGTHKFI